MITAYPSALRFDLQESLNGSIVAATSMVKEREVGTIEQLLIEPFDDNERASSEANIRDLSRP